MEKVISHHVIQSYLQRLNDLLIISNGAGELTLTKVCEGMVREIFSVIHKGEFVNVNLYVANVPAIDLALESQRLAIQVSSDKSSSKIVDTYDKFFRNQLHLRYDRLLNMILSTKGYNNKLILEKIGKLKSISGVNFEIDLDRDLINLQDLYLQISSGCSIEQLNSIRQIMEQSFEKVSHIQGLKPYYDQLKGLFFEKVMDDPAGLTLNSIYVEPSFTIYSNIARAEVSEMKLVEQHFYKPVADISIHELLNSRYSGNGQYDHFFQYPRAQLTFVLGYPGQGKTSLCSKVLFDLLTVPRKKQVFYLKLRNISDTKKLIHNPFNVIFDELENHFDSDFKKSILKNSITILDGLDELYMKDNLTGDDIEAFCKGIIHETEKYPDWEVLITTRHGYINFDRLYKEPYIALSLMPLDLRRQKQWLAAYLEFHPATWLKMEELVSLNDERKAEHNYIKELVNQPLLLYIIASLEHPLTAGTNRSEIYNKLFDQIIDRRYSKDGQIENLRFLTKEDLRAMLQEIAFMIFKSGKGYASDKEVMGNEVVQDCLTRIGDNSLSGTLKGVLISFYFKETKENLADEQQAGIEFFHKSLQEYLAAEKIVEAVMEFFLNTDKQNRFIVKKGGEVLLFFNQMFGSQQPTSEIWEFVEELFYKKTAEQISLLQQRMIAFIEYLFSKDFIHSLNYDELQPLERSLNSFISYWKVLQIINTNTNYLISKEVTQKFLAYGMLLNSQRFFESERLLSHQIFSSITVSNVSIFEPIVNVQFVNCTLENLNCYDNDFEDVTFRDCDFLNGAFYGLDAQRLKFIDCEFYELHLGIRIAKKVVFEKCTISSDLNIVRIPQKGFILFKECSFSEENYLKLSEMNKVKIQDCKIETKVETFADNIMRYQELPVDEYFANKEKTTS